MYDVGSEQVGVVRRAQQTAVMQVAPQLQEEVVPETTTHHDVTTIDTRVVRNYVHVIKISINLLHRHTLQVIHISTDDETE